MAKGCSLHLGLNRIDRTHYGSDGTLKGCIADAKAMAELAQAAGFAVEDVLLDDGATSIALASRMTGLADRLDEGDILLLTYSGHGGQVPDLDGDETSDRLDETWC